MRPLVPLFLLLVTFSAAAQFSTDPNDYERVLVPVGGRTPGLFGSVWTASVAAYSKGDANFFVPYCPRGIVCGYNYYLKGATPSTFEINGTSAFLYLPKASASDVDLVVHVRDDVHPADSNVDVPVIRESDFRPSLRLLDIPVASSVRSLLRVYSGEPGSVTLTVRDASGQVLSTRSLGLNGGEYGYNGFRMTSATGATPIELLGGVAGHSSILLEVTSETSAPVWAFVSVTNNDTQHINLIVPFRKDQN